jgi:hypothetical protein
MVAGFAQAREMSMETPNARTEGAWNAGRSLAGGLTVATALLAGLIRLVPHPYNLTPVGALGVFAGARLRLWQAIVFPLAIMIVTDVILRMTMGYPAFDPYVYGCFVVNVLLGRMLRRTESPLAIGGVSVAASILFFLVTNFGVWLASSVDPQTLPAGAAFMETSDPRWTFPMIHYAGNLSGLLACYGFGLAFTNTPASPFGFFGNQLLGDFLFIGLLFGAHAMLSRVLFPGERVRAAKGIQVAHVQPGRG